jgi:hypothetical protein
MADVDISVSLGGKANKATPVDADNFHLNDSEAADVLKTTLWSDIKAALKTYFDSVTTTLTNKTLTSPVINTGIELGHATDTTLTRVSAGVIAVEGVTVPTLSSTSTLTNKTLTAPRVGTAINDTNGNEIIVTPATASAVNQITVTNSATGDPVDIAATGDDANVSLTLTPKGTGTVNIAGSGASGILGLKDEDGSHYLNITPGSNLTADRVFTITTGDAARTLSMAGNITTAANFITSGANSLTLTTTGATDITLPTTGTVATLAGAESLSNKSVAISAALGSDDTYNGTIISGLNNSGGVTQWDTVYLNSSSQWVIADANGSGTYPARGLATATVAGAGATSVLVHGTVRNDAWNWTIGGTLYLSATAGGLTQTAPSTSGDKVQAVGFALTADIAFFDFNSTYLTVT